VDHFDRLLSRQQVTDTVDKVGDGRDEAPDWSLLMVTVRLDSAP
jgi:hypothetical protein